ncbi:DUF58 domain-containing protein [Aureispira anguillae]|uniref:DUF58 domain-containing protein n=1 Tax=Aureispira anguillae TaxID=2864201 RepID=A0A916DV03_9BACT|nr:DUF58 domain-containing protein [Aureispira anguillae]BDS14619.1 DUF58 domain-containing protein [Aureispira anguillae]
MWKKIIRVFTLQDVFLGDRFFWLFGGVTALFIASFPFPFLFAIAKATLVAAIALVFVDAFLLFNKGVQLPCERVLPRQLSLGDENTVLLKLHNQYGLNLGITIIDELPVEFQKRDFEIKDDLKANEQKTYQYKLRPTIRGEYTFHNVNLYLHTTLSILERRIKHRITQKILVYPSIMQMNRFSLMAIARISTMRGVKKVRRLGASYEFAQIRNYVKGDDYRSINWKATSRRNDLMINQFEDERSQQIFSVIDKGRSMQMPFNGMSLLDYAVNTSLVISSVALQKHDKAGLMTFSDKIGATVKAEEGSKQLNLIIETLYKEQPRNFEANYELLYTATKQFIRRRSLIFLYTNFESYSAMARVLPLLRRINIAHLLVVVFFENTEIVDYSNQEAHTTEEIYYKTIASKFVEEKHRIVQELRQYGIQAILTRPEDLSVNSINKYLEMKSRGMI